MISKRKILFFLLQFLIFNINQAQDVTGVKQHLLKSDRYSSENLDSALYFANLAYRESLELSYDSLMPQICLDLGEIYKSLGYIDSAKKYTYLAITKAQKLESKREIIRAYIALGELNRAIYHSDSADLYIRSAILLSNENKIFDYMPQAYNRLAAIYFEEFFHDKEKGKIDSSTLFKTEIFIDSSFYWENKNRDSSLLISNYNILGAYYSAKNDFRTSTKYFNEALNIAELDNYLVEIPLIYRNIAGNFNKQREYDSAIHYLNKSARLADSLELQEIAWFAYKELSEVYIAKNDYKNAYKYHLKVDSLWDISRKKNANKKFTEYKAEYETRQNQLLLQSKEKELKYRNRQVIILFIVFWIFTALGIYIIIQSKKIKRINKELNDKYEEIKELSTFKEHVRNMIIHDLKNPLSNILSKVSNKSIEYSAKLMFNLVNDILDVSKFEKTELELKREWHSLQEILDEVIGQVQHLCIEKGIRIETNVADYKVFVDLALIERVLMNLLNNAVKYAEKNTIVTISTITEDNNTWLAVKNHGKLIDEKDIDSIFKMYKQSEVIDSKNYKSTGIGLAFCKMVIDAHGETIRARNIPPDEIVFEFTLPVREKDKTAVKKEFYTDIQFNFSEEELGKIKPIVSELKKFNVHQASEIMKILMKIPDNSETLKNYKNMLRRSVFAVDEERYRRLLEI